VAQQPATTPIPVQLSATEFTACILPHLSMPKRGPKGQLGSQCVLNLIVWVLYTGMQWKCLPVPKDLNGHPAIHDTTVSKVFAQWADDGSLWQAFVASVRQLAEAKQLDLRVLHGDGTTTVAKKGGMAWGTQETNTSRARRSLPSSTIMALCELPSPWLSSMRQTWSWCRRASKR
jgi:transposase